MPETFDYESITVAGTAIGLTAGKLGPTNSDVPSRVICTLESGQIRFRADGTSPTSSEGHLLNIGDDLILDALTEMINFRAIRTGATSGVLKVSYERG